jgi:LytS/YehU family sensor histidine kinase
MRSIVRSNTVYPPFGLDISQTGPFIRDSLYFVLIISLCILFFGMYRCRRCSTLYYSLVLHGIGSAVSILTLLNALKWIHDISQYVKLVNLSMLPWIMSVICSAVFVFNIRTGGRKKSTADGRENHGCSDEKRNP